MYIMAKRYAHILQPEMRKAVAALEGKSTTPSSRSAKSEKAPVRHANRKPHMAGGKEKEREVRNQNSPKR